MELDERGHDLRAIRIVEMPDSPPKTEFQVGASVNNSSASASVTMAK